MELDYILPQIQDYTWNSIFPNTCANMARNHDIAYLLINEIVHIIYNIALICDPYALCAKNGQYEQNIFSYTMNSWVNVILN